MDALFPKAVQDLVNQYASCCLEFHALTPKEKCKQWKECRECLEACCSSCMFACSQCERVHCSACQEDVRVHFTLCYICAYGLRQKLYEKYIMHISYLIEEK